MSERSRRQQEMDRKQQGKGERRMTSDDQEKREIIERLTTERDQQDQFHKNLGLAAAIMQERMQEQQLKVEQLMIERDQVLEQVGGLEAETANLTIELATANVRREANYQLYKLTEQQATRLESEAAALRSAAQAYVDDKKSVDAWLAGQSWQRLEAALQSTTAGEALLRRVRGLEAADKLAQVIYKQWAGRLESWRAGASPVWNNDQEAVLVALDEWEALGPEHGQAGAKGQDNA